MLNIEKKNRKLQPFNMVSLADLSFLLLIFFLTNIASSSSNNGMSINLPKSSNVTYISSDTTISISSENRFFLNGKAINLKGLEKFFMENKFSKNKEIIISADKSVPVDSLMKVADIVASAGLKINISANIEDSKNE